MNIKFDLETVLNKYISIDRQHRCLLEKQVSKGSLHRSQHRVLLYIYLQKTPPTQKEIAQKFSISSAAVAVTLKKLEASGCIKRLIQKDDMRCNRITVTEKGAQILNDTKTLVDEVDSNMFKDFSLDELEAFYRCLEKIEKNLTEFEKKEMEEHEKMV